MEEMYKVQVIGWCTNDGPDGKKACRLLYQFLTYLIVIACWTHQINLILGNLFKLDWIKSTIRDTLELIKWFNNHGVALELLRTEQRVSRPGSEPLALIRPVETHWTSHFLACTRLLTLRADVQACVLHHADQLVESVDRTADAIAKAQWVISKAQDQSYWRALSQ